MTMKQETIDKTRRIFRAIAAGETAGRALKRESTTSAAYYGSRARMLRKGLSLELDDSEAPAAEGQIVVHHAVPKPQPQVRRTSVVSRLDHVSDFVIITTPGSLQSVLAALK